MSEWISVDEHMPEDGQSVLAYIPGYEDEYLRNRVAWLDCDSNPPAWICDGEVLRNVTHWQNIPAPPSPSHKESRDDE